MMFFALVFLASAPVSERLDLLKGKLGIITVTCLVWLVALLGLTYTPYLELGLIDLSLKLPIVVFPIMILSLKQDELKQSRYAAYGMVFGVGAVAILCIGIAAYKYLSTGEILFFYRDLVSPLRMMHPGYLSMYTVFALFLIGVWFYKKWSGSSLLPRVVVIFLGLLFILFLILLSSRMQILISFFLTNAFLLSFLLFKRRFRALLGLILLNSAFAFTISQFEFVQMRFYYLRNPEFSYDQEAKWNGTQMRLAIWTITLEVIQEDPWLGVGTGSAQPVLQEKYTEKGFNLAKEMKYNNHNQYLQQWMTNGIFGLFSWLLLLLLYLMLAIRSKNWVLLFLSGQIILSALTESVFQTQSGVVFIAFWFPLLLVASNSMISAIGRRASEG